MSALWINVLLFLVFLEIGCFSFGGAYSIWALIHRIFVQPPSGALPGAMPPLPAVFFYDFMEIGQLTPGPNINGALLVGHYYSPYWGIVAALIGLLLPSVVAVVALYRLNRVYGLNRRFHLFKTGALASVIGVLSFLLLQLSEKIPRENPVRVSLFVLQALIVLYAVQRRRANAILVTFLSGLAMWAWHFLLPGV
jgi:chromate transporter